MTEGFVNIYRNLGTDKIAFAWIKEEERIYGADNTGGWHLHPYREPSEDREVEYVSISDFLRRVEEILKDDSSSK